jgi:hypothetical protein
LSIEVREEAIVLSSSTTRMGGMRPDCIGAPPNEYDR